ncbi:hypothetical protein ACS0TY_012284 [Phlomoides rotata]
MNGVVSCRVQVNCSSIRPSLEVDHHPKSSLSPSISLKPLLEEQKLQNPILHHVSRTIKEASVGLLDALVDSVFEFVDQPLFPCQSNFAPVDEIGEAVDVSGSVNGRFPDDFPAGVYIRIGSNPLFGGLKSTRSIFGKSSYCWIEGEGMLHALYFFKDGDDRWMISYNNRYVESDTFIIEKARKKPAFLPAAEGDSLAILSAYLLNYLRFGIVNKIASNTNVFEHSGKVYSAAENYIPQEIDILTLETKLNWDVNGAWNRPCTSHPKKVPGTGELVITGAHLEKPYLELGVISADGNKLLHKVDLKLNRCSLCHEIGITERYNVIMDFPLTLDINRVLRGGPLIKYNKEDYARIGVMPHYGGADSVQWFAVEPSCIFHIMNCYEQDNEVVVMACRARDSIIPGPDFGLNKFEWFSKRFKQIDDESDEESFLSRAYEWRLNMQTGEVAEMNLTGAKHSMEFPMINETYIGRRNKYGYTKVVDPKSSSISGMAKYGGLAKLYLDEKKLESSSDEKQHGDTIKVEYHDFPENTFCSGAAFVAKPGDVEEEDGWIITYVHNEDSNTSHVYVVDAKNFSEEPVAIIDLPRRVPYGFHGAFIPYEESVC